MKFRHEHKYRINQADICQLKSRLGAVLEKDVHMEQEGGYTVHSLYFDNYRDKALGEKLNGTDKREKFRIRYYGDDVSFIRLEKKSKVNGLCHKVSTTITAQMCTKIICGDTSFMLKSGDPLLEELYAKMKFQLLRPVCIVVYDRCAYTHPAGNVRITIDTNVRRSLNVRDFLNPHTACSNYGCTKILEVKYDEFLPESVRNIVCVGSRNRSAISKYALMRF